VCIPFRRPLIALNFGTCSGPHHVADPFQYADIRRHWCAACTQCSHLFWCPSIVSHGCRDLLHIERDRANSPYSHAGTLIDFETGILEWMRPRLKEVKPDITDDEILQVQQVTDGHGAPCMHVRHGCMTPLLVALSAQRRVSIASRSLKWRHLIYRHMRRRKSSCTRRNPSSTRT